MAAVACRMSEAVPRLLALAGKPDTADRTGAIAALCRLPDPRAIAIYLAAIRDRDPRLRRAGESALLAIRDRAAGPIAAAARSAEFSGAAAASLERVLAQFEPIRAWRVIGPFPRTTPQVFLGERSIDFARRHAGAAGQAVSWATRHGGAVDWPGRPRRPEARSRGERRIRLRNRRIARPLRLRLRRGGLRPRGPRADAPGLQRHADRDRQRAGRLERLPPRRPGLRARRRPGAVPPRAGPQSDPGPEPPGDRALGVRRPGRPEPDRCGDDPGASRDTATGRGRTPPLRHAARRRCPAGRGAVLRRARAWAAADAMRRAGGVRPRSGPT